MEIFQSQIPSDPSAQSPWFLPATKKGLPTSLEGGIGHAGPYWPDPFCWRAVVTLSISRGSLELCRAWGWGHLALPGGRGGSPASGQRHAPPARAAPIRVKTHLCAAA